LNVGFATSTVVNAEELPARDEEACVDVEPCEDAPTDDASSAEDAVDCALDAGAALLDSVTDLEEDEPAAMNPPSTGRTPASGVLDVVHAVTREKTRSGRRLGDIGFLGTTDGQGR